MFINPVPEKSPATIFLALWKLAEKVSASDRINAQATSSDFKKSILRCLRAETLQLATQGLDELVGDGSRLDLGRVLAVMVEIDRAFSSIHPRAVVHAGSIRSPAWLRDLKSTRREYGYYAKKPDGIVVPRGPLGRLPREEYASNADCLADRFAFLSVAPLAVKEDGRPISIVMKVIESHIATGLCSPSQVGREIVGFVPVAEKDGDLRIKVRNNSTAKLVDFRLDPAIDAAARLMKAIQGVVDVDIALAPELVMSKAQVELLPNLILHSKNRPKLLVAGSGHTRDVKESQAWNESTAFNGVGAVLWTQRKIQQACIKQQRAIQFGLCSPGDKGVFFEDNASGNEVVVADIAGFGRCVVLICQDIVANFIADEVIAAFQPDWLFIPVLDAGINEGGWIHQRISSLSGGSNTRFLVCSSTVLGRDPAEKIEPACGFAIGPREKTELAEGRLIALVKRDDSLSPAIAVVQWQNHDGKWKRSRLGSEELGKVKP